MPSQVQAMCICPAKCRRSCFRALIPKVCVTAALDEDGVAYLGTQWATTNSNCDAFDFNSNCPTWGTYIMAVKSA